jgi:ribosomal protein L37AE/L43A
MTSDTCPRCGAPIEGRTIAWSIWQCGRTTDDPTGEGHNACDYASSLRDEVKAARDNAAYFQQQRNAAYAEMERMRPVVEASVRRRALWIANDHGESTREECLDAGRAEDAAIDAYREHMEATDE